MKDLQEISIHERVQNRLLDTFKAGFERVHTITNNSAKCYAIIHEPVQNRLLNTLKAGFKQVHTTIHEPVQNRLLNTLKAGFKQVHTTAVSFFSSLQLLNYNYIKQIAKNTPILVGGAGVYKNEIAKELFGEDCIYEGEIDKDFIFPLVSYNSNKTRAHIETTRGCKFKCAFCQVKNYFKYKNQDFSIIKTLIKKVQKENIKRIKFESPNFFLHPNAKEILDYCVERNIKVIEGISISPHSFKRAERTMHELAQNRLLDTFKAGLKPDHTTTHELAQNRLSNNIHFSSISIGVEGVSESLRKFVKKPVSWEKLDDFLLFLSENFHKQQVILHFIKGLPYEGFEDWNELKSFLQERESKKLKIRLNFTHFVPMVGTEMQNYKISFENENMNFISFKKWAIKLKNEKKHNFILIKTHKQQVKYLEYLLQGLNQDMNDIILRFIRTIYLSPNWENSPSKYVVNRFRNFIKNYF